MVTLQVIKYCEVLEIIIKNSVNIHIIFYERAFFHK